MSTHRQLSFAGGEVSPAIAARVDTTKYQTGLRTLRNNHILKTGGVQNRGGFEYIGPAHGSRLIPFIESADNAFTLDFADGYVRAVQGDGFVKSDTAVIVHATQANPCVLKVLHPLGHGNSVANTTAITMTLTSGGTYNVGDAGRTLTASASFFSTRFVGAGNFIRLTSAEGVHVYLLITARTSATVVTVTILGASGGATSVPADLQATATTNWARINTSIFSVQTHITISGLEGMTQLNGNTYAITAILSGEAHLNGMGYVVSYSIETTGGTPVDSSAFTAFTTAQKLLNGVSPYGLATRNKTITGITAANPPVVTLAGHGLEDGQEIKISGVLGMTELNGRHFLVSASTDDTFSLQSLAGVNINASAYTAYVSGGTAERILQLKSMDLLGVAVGGYSFAHYPLLGIDESDVAELSYTQRSAQALVFAHRDYPPFEIAYMNLKTTVAALTGTGGFTVEGDTGYPALIFRAFAAQPGSTQFMNEGVSVPTTLGFGGGSGSGPTHYAVTAVSAEGEESIAKYATTTSDDPAITGVTALTLTVGGSKNVAYYNLYKSTNGQAYGFLGTTTGTTFIDNGKYVTDYSVAPPLAFIDVEHLPGSVYNLGAVGSFGGRLYFGGSKSRPDILLASQAQFPWNFLTETPMNPGSSLATRVFGVNSSTLRHIFPCGRLLVFTDSLEALVDGDEAGVITPDSVAPKIFGYTGSSIVRPVLAIGVVLFSPSQGSAIRAISLENPLKGSEDVSVFASHLFFGKTVTDLDWQNSPNAIMWAVRSDGKLLGMTYMPEHEVFGWHRHDTDGLFKNASVVPVSGQSTLYALVHRTISSATQKYIERLREREVITDIEDVAFMDSFLKFNGWNSGVTTMTLTGGTTWAAAEAGLTLTASASFFTAADIGNSVILEHTDGSRVKLTITAFTSGTVVTVTITSFSHNPNTSPVTAITAVPVAIRGVAQTLWARAVDDLTGLHHLVGKNVTVYADGQVIANPNDSSLALKTVSATGTLSLSATYARIFVGLPYLSDIETLELDPVNRKKLLGKVLVQVENTRGLYAGRELPADSTPTSNLQTMNIYNEDIGTQSMFTGKKEVVIDSAHDFYGRIAIRQVQPLPMTVFSIVPEGLIPRST